MNNVKVGIVTFSVVFLMGISIYLIGYGLASFVKLELIAFDWMLFRYCLIIIFLFSSVVGFSFSIDNDFTK